MGFYVRVTRGSKLRVKYCSSATRTYEIHILVVRFRRRANVDGLNSTQLNASTVRRLKRGAKPMLLRWWLALACD